MKDKAILGDIHPSGQLLLTIGIGLFITIITLITGILVALPVTGKSMGLLLGGLDARDPENLNMVRYFQIISHLGMFIIPSFVMAWFFGRKIMKYLYLVKIPSGRMILVSCLLVFAAVPLINYVLEMNMQMSFPESLKGIENWMRRAEENAQQLTHTFLAVETPGGLLFNLFMIALIPAIGEELMFRGVLLRIFDRWSGSKHVAVWTTAIIFSAIHFQFFGFFPRMILGVLFGYLVVWSGSMWPAIAAHFVNNAAAVTFYYLFHHKISEGTFENLGKGSEGLIYALVSLVITIALMWWVKKAGRTSNPRIE